MPDAPNPAPAPDPGPGLVDPRSIQPGPEEILFEPDVPPSGPAQPDSDAGPPPGEDPGPADAGPGLVDPREEIPGSAGP